MKINVFFHTAAEDEKALTRLAKKAVTLALGSLARKKGEVNIIYVDGGGIKDINRRFLGKDRLTDTIAFNYPQNAPRSGEELPFGDVYVCVPQAFSQARDYGKDGLAELLTVTAHGALHLAGMDDKTKAQRDEMNGLAESITEKIYPRGGKPAARRPYGRHAKRRG